VTATDTLPTDDARRVHRNPATTWGRPQLDYGLDPMTYEPPSGPTTDDNDRVARGDIAPGTTRHVPRSALVVGAGAALGLALGAVLLLPATGVIGGGPGPVPTRTVYLPDLSTPPPSPVVVVTSVAVIPGTPVTITVSAP
jgi:hypothetical protein